MVETHATVLNGSSDAEHFTFRPQRSPSQVQNCFGQNVKCYLYSVCEITEMLNITTANMSMPSAGAQPATRTNGNGLGFHRGSSSFQALKMTKNCVCSVE